MAVNNFNSFNRFSALPANISQFGTTVEELSLQKGKPEANPVHSPMAAPRVPDTKLALSRSGSDKLRLATPTSPDVNPYEGPKSALVLSRNVEKKLSGNIVGELSRVLSAENVDPNQGLMVDLLRRVGGLTSYLGEFNKMASYVQARSIAASKG